MIPADPVNLFFGILTIIGSIIAVLTVMVILVSLQRKKKHKLFLLLDKHAILFAFVVAVIAMSGA